MSVFGTMQLQSLTEVSTGIKPFLFNKTAPSSSPSPQLDDSVVLFLNQRSRCAIILNLKGWSLFYEVISCSVLFTVKPWSIFCGVIMLLYYYLVFEKAKDFLLDTSWSSCFVSLFLPLSAQMKVSGIWFYFGNGNLQTNGSVVSFTRSQRV